MASLKDQLNDDLRAAMKDRDEVTTSALRMALTAVRAAETSDQAARELSDDEVVGVLGKEAKKRRESAEAYAAAGRDDLAGQERAELEVLSRYLPAQLSDEELEELVARVLADGGFEGQAAMGKAMKAVQAQVAGRAEGARVAAVVRRQLGG